MCPGRQRLAIIGAMLVGCATSLAVEVSVADDPETAIGRGIAFLVADQHPRGHWGGPQNAVYTFTGAVWSNPETHRSWKVATTGLCCLALMEVGATDEAMASLDRGIDYLLAESVVARPSEWDTMNSWGYLYSLQALATAYDHPRFADPAKRERIGDVCRRLLDRLAKYQSVSAGWGYLEFDGPRTVRPQWSTSFMTASAVIAMQVARDHGFEVDAGMYDRAVRCVTRSRLPTGAYTYNVRAIPNMKSDYIDNIKGSLSRIQVGNMALFVAGQTESIDRLRWGVQQFFEHHRFLDVAMNKPVPHEAFYYNSGYFYLYGHYYAAMVIEKLPPEDRTLYWPKLQHEIMKVQQADGSMWDYDMHAYGKPYGTAFSLMALGRSVR